MNQHTSNVVFGVFGHHNSPFDKHLRARGRGQTAVLQIRHAGVGYFDVVSIPVCPQSNILDGSESRGLDA